MDMSTLNSLGPTAGCVIIVVLFLKHMLNERNSRQTLEEVRMKAMRDIGTEFHKHQKETTEIMAGCIERNSQVIERNAEVIGGAIVVMERMNGIGVQDAKAS